MFQEGIVLDYRGGGNQEWHKALRESGFLDFRFHRDDDRYVKNLIGVDTVHCSEMKGSFYGRNG